jgi:hypothetical protein
LLKLVEAGKSWVFISANLKRPAKSAQDRLAYLGRQAIKAEFEAGPAEPKRNDYALPERPDRAAYVLDVSALPRPAKGKE